MNCDSGNLSSDYKNGTARSCAPGSEPSPPSPVNSGRLASCGADKQDVTIWARTCGVLMHGRSADLLHRARHGNRCKNLATIRRNIGLSINACPIRTKVAGSRFCLHGHMPHTFAFSNNKCFANEKCIHTNVLSCFAPFTSSLGPPPLLTPLRSPSFLFHLLL